MRRNKLVVFIDKYFKSMSQQFKWNNKEEVQIHVNRLVVLANNSEIDVVCKQLLRGHQHKETKSACDVKFDF